MEASMSGLTERGRIDRGAWERLGRLWYKGGTRAGCPPSSVCFIFV